MDFLRQLAAWLWGGTTQPAPCRRGRETFDGERIAPELGTGLARWHAVRAAWLQPPPAEPAPADGGEGAAVPAASGTAGGGATAAPSGAEATAHRRRRKHLDVQGIAEGLTKPGVPFPSPVPLRDMVSILVEVWREDELYQ
eukprot:TRINITY_DN67867_c0_g1_i1.p1 TRINITY_DN67867_c0_g1~~TRINITY_DN67867_c0_g1_i1.p1  ORF type:complete len:141 (+),score=17.00 TRINITY_DN67867_c0_g1_i1:65-487(+)